MRLRHLNKFSIEQLHPENSRKTQLTTVITSGADAFPSTSRSVSRHRFPQQNTGGGFFFRSRSGNSHINSVSLMSSQGCLG